MRKILKYLKPYWLFALMTPIAMVVEVLVELYQPRLMAKIVDDGVLGGDLPLIVTTGLLMLALSVVGGIGGVGSAYFGTAAAQNFADSLRRDVFRRVTSLSQQQTDKFTTGSLVTRLTNDVTQMQGFVGMGLRMFVRVLMQFGGGLIMVLTLNVRFGLVFLLSMPLQLILVLLVMHKVHPLFKLSQQRLDKVNSVVQENVTGARVVKAYVREEKEIKRFGVANDEMVDVTLRIQNTFATMGPFLTIIMNAAVIAIIFIGGYQVQARAMDVGEVMAAVTYVSQVLSSMMMMTFMFNAITRARASAERLVEVLDTTPAIENGEYIPEGDCRSVEFCDVTFRYPGAAGRPVLDHINLKVEPGQTVAIVGATGSGKTSLVSLIPRFYDTESGVVKVGGVDVREYDLAALREKIGFVLQKSELFTGTIRENILWGDENATEEEVRRAAEIAQAAEFINDFNDGYDTMVTEKGASLSGGQKQRMSIARAILKKPDLLIFDDSTSAIDLGTEARLQKALRDNLQDTTVIIIAQRVASAMGADKIAVLEDGRIAAWGTHEELLQNSEIYQDIYHSQIREDQKEVQ